jgi:cell division protein FtsQ
MGRKQAAQLDLELPDDPVAEEPPEPPTPRRVRAKPEERPNWRRRFRRVVLWGGVGAGLLTVIAGAYQFDEFLASDARFVLPAANLTIEGLAYTPRAEAVRVFESDFGRSVYLAPLGARRSSLKTIDWVADATVLRRWPNRLVVRLTERKPVAFLMLRRVNAPGSDIALIDGEGVVLRLPPRARFSLPVLAGIARNDTLATRHARVEQVKELLSEVRGYAGRISEIDVTDPDNISVTELAQGRAVRLLLGNQNFSARLNNFMNHFPDISRRLPNARTFDLRLDDHITARDGGINGG